MLIIIVININVKIFNSKKSEINGIIAVFIYKFLQVRFSQTYECRRHNIKSKDSSDWPEPAKLDFMELCDATHLVLHVLLVSLFLTT